MALDTSAHTREAGLAAPEQTPGIPDGSNSRVKIALGQPSQISCDAEGCLQKS